MLPPLSTRWWWYKSNTRWHFPHMLTKLLFSIWPSVNKTNSELKLLSFKSILFNKEEKRFQKHEKQLSTFITKASTWCFGKFSFLFFDTVLWVTKWQCNKNLFQKNRRFLISFSSVKWIAFGKTKSFQGVKNASAYYYQSSDRQSERCYFLQLLCLQWKTSRMCKSTF